MICGGEIILTVRQLLALRKQEIIDSFQVSWMHRRCHVMHRRCHESWGCFERCVDHHLPRDLFGVIHLSNRPVTVTEETRGSSLVT